MSNIAIINLESSLMLFMTTSEFKYFIRVLVGGLLGLCIGLERSKRHKEAGMGTHFIVAIASTLLTCVSLWFKMDAGNAGDGARIAAQIVSGIGFLGSGMIFFRRESMRGLTTAAGIWATAAIGMCAATGMYLLAAGTTIVIIVFRSLNYSKMLKRDVTHLLLVKLEYSDDIKEKMRKFFGFHNFHRFKITSTNEKHSSNITSEESVEQKKVIVEAVIRPTMNCSVEAITQFINENSVIKSIERLEDL